MARTTFTGPVKSNNGFEGDITGNIVGNVTGNVTGTLTGKVVESIQSLSGAGAVNLTTGMTSLTTTGAAQALTLANGTAGQVKVIVHAVDGGSAVLTPTTKIGFSTITFTNVGDAVTLVYTAAGWAIIGINGAVAA
jgi:hypothetical protein